MTENFLNKFINLVHYYILKRKSFENICEILSLKKEELIAFIEVINENSNQKIPLEFINGEPKIVYHNCNYIIHDLPCSKKVKKIMLVGDKHIDHLEDNFRYIDRVYEEAEARGVDFVLDLGDILNGPQSRVNNKKKVKTGTLEGSMEQLITRHPRNKETYFITGNHDIKFMCTDWCDIGRLIESEIPCMHFLNNLFAPINIGNFRINISHGSIEEKRLTRIKLSQEFKFLTLNDPHVIGQAHFHISNIPEKQISPVLCQIPSLKFSFDTTVVSKNKGNEIGAIFLTIREYPDKFEIEHEKTEFQNVKRLVKNEITIQK